MSQNRRSGLIIFGLGFCFFAGLILGNSAEEPRGANFTAAETPLVISVAAEQKVRPEIEVTPSPSPSPTLQGFGAENWTFSAVAKAVAPAVVNISSIRIIRQRTRRGPFGSDPFFDFFGRRYSSVPRERRERSLGSGVIISPEGYLLTNNHVVENATEILVYLPDGREFKAQIVGNDPETDVAVLKLDGLDFPTVPFGDSDAAEIGDLVLALGNPFGIGQTVTMGIISAKGRANVGIVDYEDFIQTDAAINPGNSGGALVDIKGRLIGINTAIFSKSGGYQGIGFAIPSNMAETVMNSIIQRGRFIRGWAGITFQDLASDIAHAFNAEGQSGALVNDVADDGPGEQAGIQRGDVVVAFDDQPVTGAARLKHLIALSPSGKTVTVAYLRRGRRRETQLTVTETATEYTYLSESSDQWVSQIEGVVVEQLTAQITRKLGLRKATKGVIVKNILTRSPAAYSGLRENDIILEIDHQEIEGVDHFKSLVGRAEGKKVVLLIARRGALYYLSL